MRYEDTTRCHGFVNRVQVEDLQHGPQITIAMQLQEPIAGVLGPGDEVLLTRPAQDALAAPMAAVAAAALAERLVARASVATADLEARARENEGRKQAGKRGGLTVVPVYELRLEAAK